MNLRIFVLGGIILIVSGVIQVLVRPRPARETPLDRYLNRSALRAVLFVAVGVLAVLIGLGVIPVGWGAPPPSSPPSGPAG